MKIIERCVGWRSDYKSAMKKVLIVSWSHEECTKDKGLVKTIHDMFGGTYYSNTCMNSVNEMLRVRSFSDYARVLARCSGVGILCAGTDLWMETQVLPDSSAEYEK